MDLLDASAGENNEYRRDQHHYIERSSDQFQQVVAGTQLFIVALPLVGDLQEFAKSADLVAGYSDTEAMRGLLGPEFIFFPGERVIQPVGAGLERVLH